MKRSTAGNIVPLLSPHQEHLYELIRTAWSTHCHLLILPPSLLREAFLQKSAMAIRTHRGMRARIRTGVLYNFLPEVAPSGEWFIEFIKETLSRWRQKQFISVIMVAGC
jgi:hypothetical protein